MPTQTRYPTGDSGGTWTATAGNPWECVDEVSADDTDYIYRTSASNSAKEFTFTAFSITSTSINSLKVDFRAQRTSAGANSLAGRLVISATVYNGSNQALTTSWANYSETWVTNPRTGAAWTEADIEGTGANPLQEFGVTQSGMASGEEQDVSWCNATVDYNSTTTYTKTLSLDACLLKTITKTLSLDSYLKKALTKTLSLDSYLKKVFGQTVSLDANLTKNITKTLSLDSNLTKEDVLKTLSLDSYLKKVLTQIVSLDAILIVSSQTTISTNLDAYLKKVITAIVSLDAYLNKGFTKTVSIDSYLQKTFSGDITLDAYLKKTLTKTLNLDAILITAGPQTYTISCSLDAILVSAEVEGGGGRGGKSTSQWRIKERRRYDDELIELLPIISSVLFEEM